MATIQFEDGTKVNFEGNPTPEDVAFVAEQLGIKKQTQEQPKPKSLASKVGSVGKFVVDASLPSFTEAGQQLAGRLEAPRIAESSALGASQTKAVLENLRNPKNTPESKAKILKLAQEANIQVPEEISRSIQQALGSGAITASTLLPYGKIASGIIGALGATGLKTGVQTLGAIGSGAVGGYVVDVGANMQSGKTGAEALKPGLGTVIGAGIPGAGAAIGGIRTALKDTAPTIINSLIKPLQKGFAYGKDPGRTVSELGIVANSLEELATNIGTARNTIGEKLSQYSKFIPKEFTLNASDALAPFDEAIKAAVSKNNQTLYNRLQQTKQAITNVFSTSLGAITPVGSRLLDNLTYEQGVQIKRLIGDLTEWTGKQTEDESVNGALTRMYGALKGKLDELANKANQEIAAELKKLNRQYADLTSAEVATKYRDVLNKRQNLVNLPGKIGLVGAALTAPFTGGVTAVIAAIASIGIDKALSSPAFKTRLAAWLAKAPSKQVQELFRRFPILQGEFPGDTFLKTKLGQRMDKYVRDTPPGLVIKDVSKDSFSGFTDLSTKLLEKLKGRSTVSRQFIEDLSNSPDLKQPERDLIRRVLGESELPKVDFEEYVKSLPPASQKLNILEPRTGDIPVDPKNVSSYIKVYHGTTKDSADAIRKTGFQIVPNQRHGRYTGDGIYFSPDPIPAGGKYDGGAVLDGYVDVRNYKNVYLPQGRIDWQPSSDLVREWKKKYDGVIVRIKDVDTNTGKTEADFVNEIVTFNPSTVKTKEQLKQLYEATSNTKNGVLRERYPDGANTDNTFGFGNNTDNKLISVPDFANKVKSELLPLDTALSERSKNLGGGQPRYESINLPEELRGPVANYEERVYQSPIKTSGGSVHFNTQDYPGYFAHTRIEDLPDNKTRRVIEAQSDLFQKGRLENEKGVNPKEYMDFMVKQDAFVDEAQKQKFIKDWTEKAKAYDKEMAELSKLEPYRNTWHERVIREEVKQAAKDGKTKLQFPTGETAMKIEGLGDTAGNRWFSLDDADNVPVNRADLEDGSIGVGSEIYQGEGTGSSWIITDVLGDGKFRAIPKDAIDGMEAELADLAGSSPDDAIDLLAKGDTEVKDVLNGAYEVETFDISGKVDTNNPIYKFYEKEVGKYLKNKYGATLIKDPQGVSWWEVNVGKEQSKLPVEAFGAGLIPLGATRTDKEKKKPTQLGQVK